MGIFSYSHNSRDLDPATGALYNDTIFGSTSETT